MGLVDIHVLGFSSYPSLLSSVAIGVAIKFIFVVSHTSGETIILATSLVGTLCCSCLGSELLELLQEKHALYQKRIYAL